MCLLFCYLNLHKCYHVMDLILHFFFFTQHYVFKTTSHLYVDLWLITSNCCLDLQLRGLHNFSLHSLVRDICTAYGSCHYHHQWHTTMSSASSGFVTAFLWGFMQGQNFWATGWVTPFLSKESVGVSVHTHAYQQDVRVFYSNRCKFVISLF